MTRQQLEVVNHILHNDEISTDEELVKHLVEVVGLNEEEARKVVAQRDKVLKDQFLVIGFSD